MFEIWAIIGLFSYITIILFWFNKFKKQNIYWTDLIFAIPFGPLAWFVIIFVTLVTFDICWGKR